MSLFQPKYADGKTGEKKTPNVWWYEFTYAGKRIRESAKTTRKTLAGDAEKTRRRDLERAMTGAPVAKRGDRIRSMADFLEAYAETYGITHRSSTMAFVTPCVKNLARLLDTVILPDLTEDRIRQYMKKRQEEGAAGRTINAELGVLSRAIGRPWVVPVAACSQTGRTARCRASPFTGAGKSTAGGGGPEQVAERAGYGPHLVAYGATFRRAFQPDLGPGGFRYPDGNGGRLEDRGGPGAADPDDWSPASSFVRPRGMVHITIWRDEPRVLRLPVGIAASQRSGAAQCRTKDRVELNPQGGGRQVPMARPEAHRLH
jgi:hypothetical protein